MTPVEIDTYLIRVEKEIYKRNKMSEIIKMVSKKLGTKKIKGSFEDKKYFYFKSRKISDFKKETLMWSNITKGVYAKRGFLIIPNKENYKVQLANGNCFK